MNPEDYCEPELYDRRDVYIIMMNQRVDRTRTELYRVTATKKLNPRVDLGRDIVLLKSQLVIRLAELHIAETKAE